MAKEGMIGVVVPLEVLSYEVRDITSKAGKALTFKDALVKVGGDICKFSSEVDLSAVKGKEVNAVVRFYPRDFMRGAPTITALA